ncbi:MAG: hypothetical protein WB676_22780 [Bryobacteraceae bacterium]
MLYWALVFLLIALVAGVLGVTSHNLFPEHSHGNLRLIFRAVLHDGIGCPPAAGIG